MKRLKNWLFRIALLGCAFLVLTVDLQGVGGHPEFYRWADNLLLHNRSGFSGDALPDSGFFGYSVCNAGEPKGLGYPFHSGIVEGVNDTITVALDLKVWRCGPIVLTDLNMDSCVMPVVYNDYVEAEVGAVFADTSTLSYRFDYWTPTSHGVLCNKPDTIRNSKDVWSMYFLVWGLPLGNKVIDLVQTDQTPSIFNVMRNRLFLGQYCYSEGKDVKDTINAYIMLGIRAMNRRAYTQALAWTDSVFALNDSSIAGWLLKSGIYNSMNDTTSANQAYVRIRSLIENNHDPLIDQTNPELTREERIWLDYFLHVATESKMYNDMEVRDGKQYYRW